MKKFYQMRMLFIILNLFMMTLLAGCASDTDHDGMEDDADKCPSVAGPKENGGCPVIIKIKNIHLYLDNSASMNGYYKNNTEYKTVISDLAVKMDKEIRPVDISFIADKTVPYQKSIADFTNAIATAPMAAQKSSELQRMISDIASRCDSNDISLLVSDCILSFSDKAIKANPNINKDNAGSVLKNNIYSAFIDLKKRGFGASIYGFRSRFYGTYYDYQNHKNKLKGAMRPFYVWAIARKAILARFDASLEDISSFRPEQSLHFGLGDKPVSTYTILPELERKGTWSRTGNGVTDIETSKTEPLQIGIALNLQNLPSYAQDLNYLQKHLLIATDGCTASFLFRKKSGVDKTKLHAESQFKSFEENSHFLLVSVTDMPLSQGTVHFSLPLVYDTWYQDWSTMDDRNPTGQENKTFALEHLIGGVKEAYETKNKNYIDFSLSLTK